MTAGGDLAARLQRASGVIEKSVEDDRFLVDRDSEAIYHLNPLGAALWGLLAEPHSRDEIKAMLAAAFGDIDEDRIAADADAFLDSLFAHGLVRMSGAH